MTEIVRLKWLKIALVVFGLIFLVGIYPLGMVWPSGWLWHTGYSDYHLMIVGVYATFGVFMLMAARNPQAHRSLIWFAAWSARSSSMVECAGAGSAFTWLVTRVAASARPSLE